MAFYYSVKQTVKEFLQIAIISLAIVLPIRYFLVQPFYVKGASMEPNFHDSEYLLIDELSYRFREPKRGEVVVIHANGSIKDFYIKRIIGLPGEKIEIKEGKVKIYNSENPEGFFLNESQYLSSNVETSGGQNVQLSDTEYFVLGDNRSYSSDSRSWGPVPEEDVVGKVLIRAWPFKKAQIF